jgi:hypothetical protein
MAAASNYPVLVQQIQAKIKVWIWYCCESFDQDVYDSVLLYEMWIKLVPNNENGQLHRDIQECTSAGS